jgi:hypothetical protein
MRFYVFFFLLLLSHCKTPRKSQSSNEILQNENISTANNKAGSLYLIETTLEDDATTILLPAPYENSSQGLELTFLKAKVGSRLDKKIPSETVKATDPSAAPTRVDVKRRMSDEGFNSRTSQFLDAFLSKKYERWSPTQTRPAAVTEFHIKDDLSRGDLTEIALQIRSIEEDASLISYSLASIERRQIELQDMPASPSKDLRMRNIEQHQTRILQYRTKIDQGLGSIGQEMASAAMIKNIKLTQLADIADDLEKINPELAHKLRSFLDEDISDVSRMKGLTSEEESQIKQALKESPIAIMSRGIKPPSYARQASRYAGKPLSLKMKSNPETGFIPYRTEFTSKVDRTNPDEVYMFQKYSDESIDRIQTDGLPTSVKIPRSQKMFIRTKSNVLKEATVFEVSLSVDGKRQTSWMSDEEIRSYPREFAVQKIEYHADPRGMPESTPELFERWQKTQAKPFSENASQQVEKYAEFLRSETKKPVDIHLSPLYVADIDLASIATRKTHPDEEMIDLSDRSQGYISKSHENLLKYKDKGFQWLGLREQIRHGPEFNNRAFSQRAAGDYPFTIVYVDREGASHVKIVEKGPESNPHEVLFREIQNVNKETGLKLMTNPADIVANPADYQGVASLFLPDQRLAFKNYLDDLEKNNIKVKGKSAIQLRQDLAWALPQ